MNNNTNIDNTFSFINKTYDDLSYFDLYGNSVIIFIFITLLVFTVFSYCKVMQTKEDIASDWGNQRCKPQNMAFAGLITKPEGTSAFQYTKDNFQFCVQNILTNIAGYSLQPFQYMISGITNLFLSMTNSIQQTRNVTNNIRNNFRIFGEDIFNRILNFIIPLQKMVISLKDIFQKIQGTMTGTLYTVLGTYYTLQALMGAILELIVKLLVTLVVIIVGLWVVPFTWPAAASMSAVFLGISVPLAIIVYFMSEVLHVKSSAIPKLRCFDKLTNIKLYDGNVKHIKDINVNDILFDGSYVTAKIKVTSQDLNMYNLNGVVVSESHIVKYLNDWIPVKQHPHSILIHNYNEPYLYCLNTSNKQIIINEHIFTDWDEVYGDNLDILLKKYKSTENIHKNVDFGFDKNTPIRLQTKTVRISNVNIGDTTASDGIVYGIVELANDINLLVSNEEIPTISANYKDYNYNIDIVLEIEKYNHKILSKYYV